MQKRKMLIIDDEAMICEGVALDLSDEHFEIETCTSGLTALKKLLAESYDVCICDILMPKITGLEILEQLQKEDRKPKVFVFLSGLVEYNNEIVEDAYDLGADAVFAKPYDRENLLHVLEEVFREEHVSGRTHNRVPSEFTVQIAFSDYENAMDARCMNIGRGGMFLSYDGDLPMVGEDVTFYIQFRNTEDEPIQGSATVKWLRPQDRIDDDGTVFPRGIGVAFSSLTEESKRLITRIVNSEKTKAFIPKK